MSDMVVIGAGPAGCIAARAGSSDRDVTLFEEHPESKRPVQCAGLISKSGLERLKIPAKDWVLNEVRGARFFSRSGEMLEIDGREIKAYVVDRKEFDGYLLNNAINAGVNFINERVDDPSKITFDTSNRVVIATGTNYNLHRKLNLDMPTRFLIAAQYDLKVECDPGFVELHITPEFFNWIIPAGEYARVGTAAFQNPVLSLEKFVRKLKGKNRIKSGSGVLNKVFGTIPLYTPKIRTSYGKIVTVGDAAGMVKATTGGGVVMGGIAAQFAHETNYDALWRNEIGRELYLHSLIRKFVNKIPDKNLDKLFSLFNEEKDIIETYGDMDMVSDLILKLLKNPIFVLKFSFLLPRILFKF